MRTAVERRLLQRHPARTISGHAQRRALVHLLGRDAQLRRARGEVGPHDARIGVVDLGPEAIGRVQLRLDAVPHRIGAGAEGVALLGVGDGALQVGLQALALGGHELLRLGARVAVGLGAQVIGQLLRQRRRRDAGQVLIDRDRHRPARFHRLLDVGGQLGRGLRQRLGQARLVQHVAVHVDGLQRAVRAGFLDELLEVLGAARQHLAGRGEFVQLLDQLAVGFGLLGFLLHHGAATANVQSGFHQRACDAADGRPNAALIERFAHVDLGFWVGQQLARGVLKNVFCPLLTALRSRCNADASTGRQQLVLDRHRQRPENLVQRPFLRDAGDRGAAEHRQVAALPVRLVARHLLGHLVGALGVQAEHPKRAERHGLCHLAADLPKPGQHVVAEIALALRDHHALARESFDRTTGRAEPLADHRPGQ